MNTQIYATILIRIVISIYCFRMVHSREAPSIPGLNERVQHFDLCNIRITADFHQVVFEFFSFPVTLLDSEFRRNHLLFKSWFWRVTDSFTSARGFPFKYRDDICVFDLIVHIAAEPYDTLKYCYSERRRQDNVVDKYLVIVQEHSEFQRETFRCWGRITFYPIHRIFLWKLVHSVNEYKFLIVDMLFVSRPLLPAPKFLTFSLGDEIQNFNLQKLMNHIAAKFRKQIFWQPRAQPSYSKLGRGIKLPFDERNLLRAASPDYYQFVLDLLNRANVSTDINFGHLYPSIINNEFVPDETDGFNFITCFTSDTFWSIAELFERPFQPLVWIGVAVTLIASVYFLFVYRLFGKSKFSLSRSSLHIFFNLIEVGVGHGTIHGNKSVLKIIFFFWFLMSIILTNSYKGLIIAYLSVPWAPEQDYSYFEEIMDFQFYSRIRPIREDWYWIQCRPDGTAKNQLGQPFPCNQQLKIYTSLGDYVSSAILHPGNYTELLGLFDKYLLAFTRNQSQNIFKKLTSGEKVALAGLNTEINELMIELQAKFSGVRFFKGKVNLWPHNLNWIRPKITYSQQGIELVRLMTSGVCQFWKYWLRDRQHIESKLKASTAPPEPLSLSSNVSFIFVVLALGLAVAVVGFIIEFSFRTYRKYNLSQIMKRAWKRFVIRLLIFRAIILFYFFLFLQLTRCLSMTVRPRS